MSVRPATALDLMALDTSPHRPVPDFVSLSLAAENSYDVIRELHSGLSHHDAVGSPDKFLKALLDRHALGMNCIDAVIALPHARTPAVNQIVFAIGRSPAGVYFDEQHPSIRLILLVGAPVDAVAEYLRWTAHLVRALRSSSVRDALLNAADKEAFNAVCSLYLSVPKP